MSRTGHRIYEVDGIMVADPTQPITGDDSGSTPGVPLLSGASGVLDYGIAVHPTHVFRSYVLQSSDAVNGYSFPGRFLPAAATRKVSRTRNTGTNSMQVGATGVQNVNFNSPSNTAFNANPTVPAGQEYVAQGNPNGFSARPFTSGQQIKYSVYQELAAI